MNNSFVSSGSMFISTSFSQILFDNPKTDDEDKFNLLVEKAKKLLKKNEWLDIPLLINELNVNAETAIKIMKKLRSEGLIIPHNEML